MNNRNTLTTEELELLSKAYLDCRLSKLEEKELELVLMSTPVSSPLINEARESMGIATLLQESPAPRKAKPVRRYHRLAWGAVAACLAVAVGVAVKMQNNNAPLSGPVYTVYVDGKQLSQDEAEKFALQKQSECMELLAGTVSHANSVRDESLKMLNLIPE